MKRNCILVIMVFIVSHSCMSAKKADLIVKNGNVYLVDDEFSRAESIAVTNGKIVATGTSEQILSEYHSNTIIDAAGKFIYPGFNDAHCHFYGYGESMIQYADLRGTSSPEEIYEQLQNHHNKFGGKWILGRNWDQNDWENTGFPDKIRLDQLFPETPVYLVRVDGHAVWCNSKALELAGITNQSKVTGGIVELKNGETTGILVDKALELIVPNIPKITTEQQKAGLLEAQKKCFANGLTSVTDCGLDKSIILLMQQLQNLGELKMRVNAMINPNEENFEFFIENGFPKSERLVVNTIKIYADGALGSRGALLLEEYSDSRGNNGIQLTDQENFNRICKLAYENNFVVATHGIGDSANRMILNIYGQFLKGKNDRRWRIEHAQIINPEDFEKFEIFSVVPSVQTTHATSDMYWAEDRLGSDRLKGAYAWQSLLKVAGWLPNGTDFPVEEINPLFTFYAAVFRTDHNGWPEGGWRVDESLSREQALRSVTIWPAKASFEENLKGSIEPGKLADFVIIDTDLMNASPREILQAKIESTWISGEKVFDE